jgi:hypothetical protein
MTHNEELHNLNSSYNIIKMRWVGGAFSTHASSMHMEFWLGNLKRRDNLGDLGIDGTTILKWTLTPCGHSYVNEAFKYALWLLWPTIFIDCWHIHLEIKGYSLGFQVLTMMVMKNYIF